MSAAHDRDAVVFPIPTAPARTIKVSSGMNSGTRKPCTLASMSVPFFSFKTRAGLSGFLAEAITSRAPSHRIAQDRRSRPWWGWESLRTFPMLAEPILKLWREPLVPDVTRPEPQARDSLGFGAPLAGVE